MARIGLLLAVGVFPIVAIGAPFMRGDATANGHLDLADAIQGLSHLFRGAAPENCLDAYDADDSGVVNVGDVVRILSFLFARGPQPSAPFPAAGFDPTPTDTFTCGDAGPSSPALHVRPGARGDGSGRDWSNALRALPTSLARGCTYYLASGSYGGLVLDDAESGERWITIRKATAADHGSATGWIPAYGEGVALLTSLEVATGRYVIDGRTGAAGADGCGIEVFNAASADTLIWLVTIEQGVANVALRGLEIHRPAKGYRGHGIYAALGGNRGITLSGLWIHDLHGVHIYLIGAEGVVVEDSCFARNQSTPDIHSESIQARGTTDLVVRNSWFEDIEGTAVIISGSGDSSRWAIHGNVFYSTPGFPHGNGHGTIADNFRGSIADVAVYNNTFAGVAATKCGIRFYNGKGSCVSRNNLFWGCAGVGYIGTSHDYDSFYDCTFVNGEFARSAHDGFATGSPFADAAGRDFRLRAPTAPGARLAPPYDRDRTGAPRGADGEWDRGAFEYSR